MSRVSGQFAWRVELGNQSVHQSLLLGMPAVCLRLTSADKVLDHLDDTFR